MKQMLLILFMVLSFCARAQVISTVVGDGNAGYYGDGGPATSAQIYGAQYCTFDDAGNMYIADGQMHLIRKVNTSGVISTVAGYYSVSFGASPGFSGDNIPATASQLNMPRGVAVDHFGNLYISDAYNYRIRKVTPAGIITTYAGTGTAGISGDGGPATAAKLRNIWGITLDEKGNLYIADINCNCIRKVDTAGIITNFAGNGSSGRTGDGGPATAASFSFPIGVAADRWGNVYVADELNDCIRKIDTNGIISTFAGNKIVGFVGDGGPATAAQMHWPVCVVADRTTGPKSGYVYFSDQQNHRIRQVNTAGIISTIAGNGAIGYNGDGIAPTSAELYSPFDVAVNSTGTVYIADAGNYRIRKIGPGQPTEVNLISHKSTVSELYPNPAKANLSITATSSITNLTITNLLGQTLYTHEYNAPQVQVNVETLPPGMYLITVQCGQNDRVVTRRFVKE